MSFVDSTGLKVHLVDGTYELFRAFYGPPGVKNADGFEVGAARAFLRTLVSLLSQSEVTHVACAFDHVIESFRNELFAGYKTGIGIEPTLYAQFPLAERVSQVLGIVTWSMIEFEADDAIATAAARFAADARVEQVVICSPDKDMAQCVQGHRVIMLDRLRQKSLGESEVLQKFGVPPASIPDLLALVGDSADGIPGIPRWGMKSAALLLARFGSIEAIPDDPRYWDVPVRSGVQLASTLAMHRAQALLYKRLATLRLDVPLQESLGDLEWKGASRPALIALCQELGDASLVERVPRFDG